MFNNKLKAELFQQLSTMENAGFPLIQAIQLLLPNKDKKLNKTLATLVSHLKRGLPLSKAGLNSGLFSDIDSMIIKAATDSGKLDDILKKLAKQYELRSTLKQKMKSQLVFPIFIFILAVFIGSIPDLATGAIDAVTYFSVTVFFLIKLCLILYIVIKLPSWLKNGTKTLIDRLILNIPIIGKHAIKHQITFFFETLGLLLQAGIPAFEAMPKAVGTIDNIIVKTSFDPVIIKLKSHAALTDALATNTYIPNVAIEHIRAGELSGRLDGSMLHYGQIAREEVTSSSKQIATWIPRIIYGLIAIHMIISIFSSNVFIPKA